MREPHQQHAEYALQGEGQYEPETNELKPFRKYRIDQLEQERRDGIESVNPTKLPMGQIRCGVAPMGMVQGP